MGMTRLALATALWCCAMLCAGVAEAEDKERYFYFDRDYGTQALYNPLYVLVNRGFDVLQIRPDARSPFTGQNYGQNGKNVADNLAHPFERISEEGWGKIARTELFPLSFSKDTARWVPNYSLHLIGGGMTFAALNEWFDAHNVPGAWPLSAATILGAAFINETLENKGIKGRNTDCIADFYFFDIGGILLFSFRGVQRFFGQELVIADWSPPPALTYPGFDLHNHGNYFAAKWRVPFYPRLRAFVYFGMADLFGFSYRAQGEYSISVAGGVRSTRFRNVSKQEVLNTVDFVPALGIFLDRNNSLLASLELSRTEDYMIHFNLLPGAMRSPRWLGFWTVVSKQGQFLFGVSTSLGFGVGTGRVQ